MPCICGRESRNREDDFHADDRRPPNLTEIDPDLADGRF